MPDTTAASCEALADSLVELWAQQGRDGFLLSDPATAQIEVREVFDPECGVSYRYLWMPHREMRGDVHELQRRGILNPERDERKLFRDNRDPSGRHCFLCADNVAECHPMEVLTPLELAGRHYFAGANFAWIEPDHFTVMAAEHCDQTYSRHVLEAMVDLHRKTGGRFRVLFNGCGAGATIPWHLHYQITTTAMPIERLTLGREAAYPTAVCRFDLGQGGIDTAHLSADKWIQENPQHHSLNILVATIEGCETVFIFPRDQRRAQAKGKGLVGGFEVAGDFVLSAPTEDATFKEGTVETARRILNQVRPQSV